MQSITVLAYKAYTVCYHQVLNYNCNVVLHHLLEPNCQKILMKTEVAKHLQSVTNTLKIMVSINYYASFVGEGFEEKEDNQDSLSAASLFCASFYFSLDCPLLMAMGEESTELLIHNGSCTFKASFVDDDVFRTVFPIHHKGCP